MSSENENETIIPNDEAITWVEQNYPDLSDAETFRLAQSQTLLRVTGSTTLEEVEQLAENGKLDEIVRDHNRRIKVSDKPICIMCEDPIEGQIWVQEGGEEFSYCEDCVKEKIPNWPGRDKSLTEKDIEFLKGCKIVPYE